jgi:transcriptional regulator with XRE-family HTH domain
MADQEDSDYTRLLGAEIRSRRVAKGMSLRGLAKELGLSGHGTLVDYEHGRRIPPADLVAGCERIFQVSDGVLRNLREKALAERANHQADLLLSRPAQPAAAPSPEAEDPPVPVGPPRRRWQAVTVVLVVAAVGLGIGIWRLRTAPTPNPSPPAGALTSGPSCATGAALPLDTSGSWTTLAGSATAGCTQALIHEATDSGDGANWIFNPGVGKTCMFRVHIPNSAIVTAKNVTYQAWDSQPGEHHDVDRIGDNVPANQQANRGGTITVTFGPTKNGTIDLQLYDDFSEHAIEVADTVTATCR